MEEICAKEGIEADHEVLSVLAQAGEGSVRDSLSALDQAIACCGSRLDAAEVRSMLGMFSLESLDQVTQALTAQDSRRMLELVAELERNGRNLQHFCRELARYFRNLLVAKVAGAGTRLISASPREQERLAEIAAGFSEDDLARYLQLTLDLFKDLQFSLQPRLHLEIGLIRLVYAARLVPIEEALTTLEGGGSAPVAKSPKGPPSVAKPAPPQRNTTSAQPPAAPPPSDPPPALQAGPTGDWRSRLHAALTEMGMKFTADAVEHSDVREVNNELHFTAPEEFALALSEKDILKAVQKVGGRPMRIRIALGDARTATAPLAKPAQDDVSARALGHPEVKRFQEMFPDAQVRVVRNLKE
jgi:DNA polymerase-3 subunit gamma/tau